LEANWLGGGTLRLTRLITPKETGKFLLEGTAGNKIDWEMVPMGEDLVETGQLPGADPKGLSGLDAVVHHPANRFSALILRMVSSAIIVDRTTFEPVCVLHMPEGSPGNLPIKKVSSRPDAWEVRFEDIKCVGHEAGFSPDGRHFTMMNNIQQNNMAVFDTSGSCVVDTKTWKIIKKFQNIGPDCQTMSVSYDGKYVFQIFSGFQRLPAASSGCRPGSSSTGRTRSSRSASSPTSAATTIVSSFPPTSTTLRTAAAPRSNGKVRS